MEHGEFSTDICKKIKVGEQWSRFLVGVQLSYVTWIDSMYCGLFIVAANAAVV